MCVVRSNRGKNSATVPVFQMRFERSLSCTSKNQSSGDQNENGSTICAGADCSSSGGSNRCRGDA
jgi:hypothetical protein